MTPNSALRGRNKRHGRLRGGSLTVVVWFVGWSDQGEVHVFGGDLCREARGKQRRRLPRRRWALKATMLRNQSGRGAGLGISAPHVRARWRARGWAFNPRASGSWLGFQPRASVRSDLQLRGRAAQLIQGGAIGLPIGVAGAHRSSRVRPRGWAHNRDIDRQLSYWWVLGLP
jgi:hypothetical protein